MSKKLLIVESPTKAKTIKKFLDSKYEITSCVGHIRDLPQSAKDIPEKYKKKPWANLGVNTDNKFEPIYCIPKDKDKVIKQIKSKLKEADELYLATDEDREGESISWHLVQVLKPKIKVKRMIFHEITKSAIKEALVNTRDIDDNLVKAQEARRILDRLVGYTISPLLWKKLAYGLSAGRVQSVAVKILTAREMERINFVPAKYGSGTATFVVKNKKYQAKLKSVPGKNVAVGTDFSPTTGKLNNKKVVVLDKKIFSKIESSKNKPWEVSKVNEKQITKKPPPPFITSTLQQVASRRFSWSASKVMKVAQSLYEQGFITYMRTDSTSISKDAIKKARGIIEKFGKEYLPSSPNVYKQKSKSAQEAHEAIRPAGDFIHPDKITKNLPAKSNGEPKLYELIWKRTLASQMTNSIQKQVSLEIKPKGTDYTFVLSGTTIEFDGFLKLYNDENYETTVLPKLKVGENLKCADLEYKEHETKPPFRYSEAMLIQTMEKEGIGRPSTYAPTISNIIQRGYVTKDKTSLIPTFKAMMVSKLLTKYFPEYVDLSFTSKMEEDLDRIAAGKLNHVDYLDSIYSGKSGLKDKVLKKEKLIDPSESRTFLIEKLKKYEFKIGRFGTYACTKQGKEEVKINLPDDLAPSAVDEKLLLEFFKGKENNKIGVDKETGLTIYALSGKYGPYLQLGENDKKPKRISIPEELDPSSITLKQATFLLSLPSKLGVLKKNVDTPSVEVMLGISRFGVYVACDGEYRSVPKNVSIFDVDLKLASDLLKQEKRSWKKKSNAIDLGPYPKTKSNIFVHNGKYGPYIKFKNKNYSIKKDLKPEEVQLSDALEIIDSSKRK